MIINELYCPDIIGSKIYWFSALVKFTTEVFIVTVIGDIVFILSLVISLHSPFLEGEKHIPMCMVDKNDPQLFKLAASVMYCNSTHLVKLHKVSSRSRFIGNVQWKSEPITIS